MGSNMIKKSTTNPKTHPIQPKTHRTQTKRGPRQSKTSPRPTNKNNDGPRQPKTDQRQPKDICLQLPCPAKQESIQTKYKDPRFEASSGLGGGSRNAYNLLFLYCMNWIGTQGQQPGPRATARAKDQSECQCQGPAIKKNLIADLSNVNGATNKKLLYGPFEDHVVLCCTI